MSCRMIELSNNQFMQISPIEDYVTNKKKPSRRNPWGNSSYADLITQAIESSPEKKLTLSQIYDWMVRNIPHFRNQGSSNSSAGWKNSIRHNLSLHKKFLRIRNDGTTGKSSWWTVNKSVGTGRTTRRKSIYRKKKNKSAAFHQKTEIFRKLKITGQNLLDCLFPVPNNEGGTRNLQRNVSKLVLNSPERRLKSCSLNSSEDMAIHCNATFNTDGYQDTLVNFPNSNAYQTTNSLLNDPSHKSNGIRTNYSLNKESKNEVETFSTVGNKFYANDELDVYSREEYLPNIASTFSIEENVSLNVSREYFKSPHHLSGSYITSEIGKVPSEIRLHNSIYVGEKAHLNTSDLPTLSENIIRYMSSESNSFNFNQKTAFGTSHELQDLTLYNPQESEFLDHTNDSLSKSLTIFNQKTSEDQIGENKVNFHLDNFCKLDVELISKTRLLLEGSDISDSTEDSVDKEDNLTMEEETTITRKKPQSRKCIRRIKDFTDGEKRTSPVNMNDNSDSDKYSDYTLSPNDSASSCSKPLDSDSVDLPKSYTFTDDSQLEYLLCLERYSYYSLGFIPVMISSNCKTFYPVEVFVDYENWNENSTNTEEPEVKKVKFSRFVPVYENGMFPFLKPTDSVSKTIKAFINSDTKTEYCFQNFPTPFDKLTILIHLMILNAVNMALLRIQIMSSSQILVDNIVQTFNKLSNKFTLKQMLCFAMEFLMLVTNLYYIFIHKVTLNQFHLNAKSDIQLPRNTSITNAGECIATYLNSLYISITVQFSEKMLTDSKLRHFTSPPKFNTFVSVYLNDPDRTNVGIAKEELASTLNLVNHDFNLAFKWYSYQPNASLTPVIYAGYFKFPPDVDNTKENCKNSCEYPVTYFEATLPSFSSHHTVPPNFKIHLRPTDNPIPTSTPINIILNDIEVASSHESNVVNPNKHKSTNTVDHNIRIDSSHATSAANKGKRGPFNISEIGSPMNLASTSSNFRNEVQLQHTHNRISTNIVENGVQVNSSHEADVVNTDKLISTNTVGHHIPVDPSYEIRETDVGKSDQSHSHEFSSPWNLASTSSNFQNEIQLQYTHNSISNIVGKGVQINSSHEANTENIDNPIPTNTVGQHIPVAPSYEASETDVGKSDQSHSHEFSSPWNLASTSSNFQNEIQLQYTHNSISNIVEKGVQINSSHEANTENIDNPIPTNTVGQHIPVAPSYEASETDVGKGDQSHSHEFSSPWNLASTSSNFQNEIQLQYTHNSISNIVGKGVQINSSHEANTENIDNPIPTNTVGQHIPVAPSYEASETDVGKGDQSHSHEFSSPWNLASTSSNFRNEMQLQYIHNPISDIVENGVQINSSHEVNTANIDNPIPSSIVGQHIPLDPSYEGSETGVVKGSQFQSRVFNSVLNLAPSNFLNDIQLQYADTPIYKVKFDTTHDINVENNNPAYTNIMKQNTQTDTTYQASEANRAKGGIFRSHEFSLPKNLALTSDNILNAMQLQYENKTISNNVMENIVKFDSYQAANVVHANSAIPTNTVGHSIQIEPSYEANGANRAERGLIYSHEFSSPLNLAPASPSCLNAIQLKYTHIPISTNIVDNNIKVYSSYEATAANTDNLVSTTLVGHATPINPIHKASGIIMGIGSPYQSQEFSNLMKSASPTQFRCIDHPRSTTTVENNIQVCPSSVISEANRRIGVEHSNVLKKLLMRNGKNFDILPTDLNDVPLCKIPPVTARIYKNLDFSFGAYDNEFDNYLKQFKHRKNMT